MAKSPAADDRATDQLEAYEALRPYMVALMVGGVVSGVASLILSMEFLFECLLGVPASALSIIVGGTHVGHWVKGSRTAGVAQISSEVPREVRPGPGEGGRGGRLRLGGGRDRSGGGARGGVRAPPPHLQGGSR